MMKKMNKIKVKTAARIYFFIILMILLVQLFTCRTEEFETYVFGEQADQYYEILDGHYIDTEFAVTQKGASGIILNGYLDNGIEFKNEKLLVDFWNAETDEYIQRSEILFADQIDEKNIAVPFEQEVLVDTHVKMRVYSEGCKNNGPRIGISESNDNAEYSWLDGELSEQFICASLYCKEVVYGWLKPSIYFVAEILAGIFFIILHKKMQMPLFLPEKQGKKKSVKVSSISGASIGKTIVIVLIACCSLFVFFDYIHMKTMESNIRAKDPEVICERNTEMEQAVSLKEGDTISQTFTVSGDNLSAVAVCITNQENVNAQIEYKLYDLQTGEQIVEQKKNVSKLETLSRHLNETYRSVIAESIQDYYVLEFSDIVENSSGKQYELVITNNKTKNGNLIISAGMGEEYPFELNGESVSGNICLIGLFSNQTEFDVLFKYMAVILTLLLLGLIILSGLGRQTSVGMNFVVAALVLTFLYSFLIPPYCVPDERAHIDAVYRLSNELMGVKEAPAPGRIYKRACDIDPSKENTMDVSAERYRELYENLLKKAEDETLEVTYADNPVANVTFLNYLPAAVGFTIARILHLNFITMIMFGRWMNALASILLIWLAIRKIPFGKTTLAVLGLIPIVIQQIASCSYDGILLGVMFVYFAYAFSLLYSDERCIWDFGMMLLSGSFAAAACKGGVYIPLLGLVLLVFWEIGKNLKERIGWTVGAAIPVMFVFIGQFSQTLWDMFFRQSGSAYRSGVELYNLSDFIQSPNKLIRIYQNTIAVHGDTFLQQILGGKLGRLEVYIPWYILMFFFIILVLSSMKQKDEKTFIKKGQRYFIVLLGCISTALTMLSMLLAWTQNTYNYITGLQGRYFLPVMAVMFLVLRNGKVVHVKKNRVVLMQLTVLANVLTCGLILLSVLGE